MEQKSIGLLSGGETITVKSMKDQAYALIKDAILYHKLTAGEIYSQETLCTELGISRTPVREALLELQLEGYVSFSRGKGIVIVPLDDKRAEEIVEARRCLELWGCRHAAKRRTEEDLALMREVMDSMQQSAGLLNAKIMYPLDRRFHELIFAAARNSWMQEQIGRLRDNFLRFDSFSAFDDNAQATDVLEEHRAIYEAIAAGDPKAAEDAMRNHLGKTSKRTLAHLSELRDENEA